MGASNITPYVWNYDNKDNYYTTQDTYYRLPLGDTGECKGKLRPICHGCGDKELILHDSHKDCNLQTNHIIRSNQTRINNCINSKSFYCEHIMSSQELFLFFALKNPSTVFNTNHFNIYLFDQYTPQEYKNYLLIEAVKYYVTVSNSISIEFGSYLDNWLKNEGYYNADLNNFLKYICTNKATSYNILGNKLCTNYCNDNDCNSINMFKCSQGIKDQTTDQCIDNISKTNDSVSKIRYIEKIKDEITNLGKNVFDPQEKQALDKLILYSRDPRVKPEDRGRFDPVWDKVCNDAYNLDPNNYPKYCSCIIPQAELYKYPIAGRPDCLLNKCANNIDAYQPWTTMGSKGTMDCPSVCTQNILAQSGNLTIIENINLAQSCYSKSSEVSKSIDDQVLKEISEPLLVYHIACVLTNATPLIISTIEMDKKLVPYKEDVTRYNTFIAISYKDIFSAEISVLDSFIIKDKDSRDKLGTQLLAIQNTNWSTSTAESYTAAKNESIITSAELDVLNETIKNSLIDTLGKMEEYKTNKKAIENEILEVKKDLANRILSTEDSILADQYIDDLTNANLGIDDMEVKLFDIKKILEKYQNMSSSDNITGDLEKTYANSINTINGLKEKATIAGIDISKYIPSDIVSESNLIALQNYITELQSELINATNTTKIKLAQINTSSISMWIAMAIIISVVGIFGIIFIIIMIIRYYRRNDSIIKKN